MGVLLEEGRVHIREDGALRAERHVLLKHAHRTRVGQGERQVARGEGAQVANAQHARCHALLAQAVDGLAHEARHAAQAHHDVLGVLAAVFLEGARVGAAAGALEGGLHLVDDVDGIEHVLVGVVLVVAVVLGAGRVAHVHGMVEVELVRRGVGWQERVGLLGSGDLHGLVGVREREAVEVHHDGRHDARVLCQAICHEGHVERLLVVLRVALDPAVVEQRQRVALVAVDVPGKRRGTVGVHHDDGEATAGRVGEHLGHVEQALARGGREGARARGAGTHGAAQRGVLAFHVDVFGVKLAGLDHLGEALHHHGLRGDGVGADHLGSRQAHALGEGLVT